MSTWDLSRCVTSYDTSNTSIFLQVASYVMKDKSEPETEIIKVAVVCCNVPSVQ